MKRSSHFIVPSYDVLFLENKGQCDIFAQLLVSHSGWQQHSKAT